MLPIIHLCAVYTSARPCAQALSRARVVFQIFPTLFQHYPLHGRAEPCAENFLTLYDLPFYILMLYWLYKEVVHFF